jgi:hypothetical protein
MAENPVSTISSYFRKPDHSFDPCEYAGYLPQAQQLHDAYAKKTCLWTGGGFRMPPKRPVRPALKSYINFMSPSKDRANKRSATPRGFASTVFEANASARAGRRESRFCEASSPLWDTSREPGEFIP